MPNLDQAFSDFLKALRGKRTYASLADELGIAESTLYRLINGQQSATLRAVEAIMERLELSITDVFGKDFRRRARPIRRK